MPSADPDKVRTIPIPSVADASKSERSLGAAPKRVAAESASGALTPAEPCLAAPHGT